MIADLNVIQALESELRADEDQYLESSGKTSLKESTDLPLKGWSVDGTKMKDGGTLVEKKGNTIVVRAGTDVNGGDDTGRTFSSTHLSLESTCSRDKVTHCREISILPSICRTRKRFKSSKTGFR